MKEPIYSGWLTSTSLVKRSIAVFGHFMLGYVLVALSFGIVVLFISLFV